MSNQPYTYHIHKCDNCGRQIPMPYSDCLFDSTLAECLIEYCSKCVDISKGFVDTEALREYIKHYIHKMKNTH